MTSNTLNYKTRWEYKIQLSLILCMNVVTWYQVTNQRKKQQRQEIWKNISYFEIFMTIHDYIMYTNKKNNMKGYNTRFSITWSAVVRFSPLIHACHDDKYKVEGTHTKLKKHKQTNIKNTLHYNWN